MGIKKISVKQYLNKIAPNLYDFINDHKIARRICKIQINMHVNFISSRDTGETRIFYVWSDNISIMQGKDTYDIIGEIFESFLYNYQKVSKNTKRSNFVFESDDLLDYKLHRVRLKRGGSYIKSPKWLENKKATMNPKNDDDDDDDDDHECLQRSIICALNYNEIMKKEFENIFKEIDMKIKIFRHIKGTGKILNKIMNQLLLMSYFHQKIVKK